MTDTTFIYALVDPRNNRVRYIGKSDDPQKRLLEHYKETISKNHNPYMTRWLNKLSRMSLEPEVMVVDEVPKHCWPKYEKAWIRSMKAAYGKQIINIHEGGTGGDTMSGRKHSLETRQKMSNVARENRSNRARSGHLSWLKCPIEKRSPSVGENSPTAILDNEQVREIYRLYKTGNYTQPELGTMFGVNYRTISAIVCGVSWKHLNLKKDEEL